MTGLDGDEAYYWTYSRHLQWGYFDHPPVVALSVKLGELFGHGRLFTRLGAVLLSTLTIYFGYRALPDRLKD
ncbi:MAG: ArnT family glycosyltransferase, partial [Flavisolibacter sp.]